MDQPTIELVTSADIVKATGLTYRQLDYLVSWDVIPVAKGGNGSGNTRWIDPAYLPALTTIRKIGKAMAANGGVSVGMMKQIIAEYDNGCVTLADGITVCWEV
jgi:hypothetical protein